MARRKQSGPPQPGDTLSVLKCGHCGKRLGRRVMVKDLGFARQVRDEKEVEGARMRRVLRAGETRRSGAWLEWRCAEHVDAERPGFTNLDPPAPKPKPED